MSSCWVQFPASVQPIQPEQAFILCQFSLKVCTWIFSRRDSNHLQKLFTKFIESETNFGLPFMTTIFVILFLQPTITGTFALQVAHLLPTAVCLILYRKIPPRSAL